MSRKELADTIEALACPGKGVLAADESTGTIGKRFATIDLENTEQNRRDYRTLLCTTPGLSEFVSGVIFFEETLTQANDKATLLPEVLHQEGIVPGIKVDKGLIDLANAPGETVTQGLDGLADRLSIYKDQGARFAKWRNVYTISASTPSMTMMKTGAEILARYAAICQQLDIVPIVEPEVLMDGAHDIEHCAGVTEIVLHELFNALFNHQVQLEYILLKPNMVLPGADCKKQATAEEIASYTLNIFYNNVPAAVPSINFLSGGQSPEQATVNLNAINLMGGPWYLSFSYGRALQETCIKTWRGKAENREAAQQELLKRAKLNGAATVGKYTAEMEK